MTLYGIARIAKFLALLTYFGALVAGFTAPSSEQRKRVVHGLASPALLGLWAAGFTLAWLRGTSLGELWILAGLALSLLSGSLLSYAVGRDVRTPRLFAASLLPLALAVVLMVLRPKWPEVSP